MGHYGKQSGLWMAPEVASSFSAEAEVVVLMGDSADRLREVPDETAKLIITSPPYNIGKVYETAKDLEVFLQARTKSSL